MKSSLTKIVLLYGIMLALLASVLSYMKFNFLLRELSVEFYVGVVALAFTALGVWMGRKLVSKNVAPREQFIFNEAARERVGITRAGLPDQLSPHILDNGSSTLYIKPD